MRYIWLLLLLMLFVLPAWGTTVTGTINDPGGSPYAGGSFIIDFVNGTGCGLPLLSGSPFQTQFTGQLSSTGALPSLSLADNNIVCVGSQWKFSICNSTRVACFSTNITITGASQNVGATLTAASVALPGTQATSFSSSSANPSTAGVVRLATGDTMGWRNAGNTANCLFADTGAAAAGNGNLADVLSFGTSSTCGLQTQAYVDFSAAPAQSGVLRTGNNVPIFAARNAAGSADISFTINGSNNPILAGTGLTFTSDGYYWIGPENCGMTLSPGTFAANPASSGGLSAPAMVKAATGNNVLQLTTTAAANTTEVTCDFNPPTRITSGKSITITQVDAYYGYQTTALTTIGTPGFNSVTYGAAGGAAQGTVGAVGGALTTTPGTSHSTPGAVTTTGQCYHESNVFGTPFAHNTDNIRLTYQQTFAQSGAAATVMQFCGLKVLYTLSNPF